MTNTRWAPGYTPGVGWTGGVSPGSRAQGVRSSSESNGHSTRFSSTSSGRAGGGGGGGFGNSAQPTSSRDNVTPPAVPLKKQSKFGAYSQPNASHFGGTSPQPTSSRENPTEAAASTNHASFSQSSKSSKQVSVSAPYYKDSAGNKLHTNKKGEFLDKSITPAQAKDIRYAASQDYAREQEGLAPLPRSVGAKATQQPTKPKTQGFGKFSKPTPTGRFGAYSNLPTQPRAPKIQAELKSMRTKANTLAVIGLGQGAKAQGYNTYSNKEITQHNTKWEKRGTMKNGKLQLSPTNYKQYQLETKNLKTRLAGYQSQAKYLEAESNKTIAKSTQLTTIANEAAPEISYEEWKKQDTARYNQAINKQLGGGYEKGLYKVKENKSETGIKRYTPALISMAQGGSPITLSEPAKQVAIPTGIGFLFGGPAGAAVGASVGVAYVAGTDAPIVAEKYDIPFIPKSQARVVKREIVDINQHKYLMNPAIAVAGPASVVTTNYIDDLTHPSNLTPKTYFKTPNANYTIRSKSEELNTRMEVGGLVASAAAMVAAPPIVQASAKALTRFTQPDILVHTQSVARVSPDAQGKEKIDMASHTERRNILNEKVGETHTGYAKDREIARFTDKNKVIKEVQLIDKKTGKVLQREPLAWETDKEKIFSSTTRHGSPIRETGYTSKVKAYSAKTAHVTIDAEAPPIEKHVQAFKSSHITETTSQKAYGVGKSTTIGEKTIGKNYGYIKGKGTFEVRYTSTNQPQITQAAQIPKINVIKPPKPPFITPPSSTPSGVPDMVGPLPNSGNVAMSTTSQATQEVSVAMQAQPPASQLTSSLYKTKTLVPNIVVPPRVNPASLALPTIGESAILLSASASSHPSPQGTAIQVHQPRTIEPVTAVVQLTKQKQPLPAEITIPKAITKPKELVATPTAQSQPRTRPTTRVTPTLQVIQARITPTDQKQPIKPIPQTETIPARFPDVQPYPTHLPPYEVPVSYIPPVLVPIPNIPLGVPSGRGGGSSHSRARKARYAPSVTAAIFGATTTKKQKEGPYTGLEVRPFVIKKAKKKTKRKRKK